MRDFEPGTFSGPVKVEWLVDDSRLMGVLGFFYFTDSSGRVWAANKGDIINGASIPRIFWWLTGSPYVGKYRRASVIHDVYCERRNRPAQDVHDVFYEMMKADGVPRWKAYLMYQAVDKFGPRW